MRKSTLHRPARIRYGIHCPVLAGRAPDAVGVRAHPSPGPAHLIRAASGANERTRAIG
jgi:hypothetical protein